MQDGLAGVAVIRIALSLLQRLHQARLRMDDGESASDAVRLMRPPVYFRTQTATLAALSVWTSAALLRVIEEARQVELACKRTGQPAGVAGAPVRRRPGATGAGAQGRLGFRPG